MMEHVRTYCPFSCFSPCIHSTVRSRQLDKRSKFRQTMGSSPSVKKMVARGLAAMKGTCVLHRSVSAWTSTRYGFSLLTRSQHGELWNFWPTEKHHWIKENYQWGSKGPRVLGKEKPWFRPEASQGSRFLHGLVAQDAVGGWMLMDDPIDPGKQVDIPWYTPKKERTKKKHHWYPWTFLPNIHIQNKVVTLFFCWLDKLSDATLRIWQTPHHLPCLGSYPSCLEVACVLESQERDEQVRWGRQARCRMHRKDVFFLWG